MERDGAKQIKIDGNCLYAVRYTPFIGMPVERAAGTDVKFIIAQTPVTQLETFHPIPDCPPAKNRGRPGIGWLLLAIYWSVAGSVAAAGADSPWYTRVWQSGDGLPNDTVSGVAQTRDGYLWLASGPLTRFDGAQFERLDPDTIFDENHRRIEALLGSNDGSLWLALDHGLVVRMNAGNVQKFDIHMPDAIVQTLLETS